MHFLVLYIYAGSKREVIERRLPKSVSRQYFFKSGTDKLCCLVLPSSHSFKLMLVTLIGAVS